jgi:hypothetical protein
MLRLSRKVIRNHASNSRDHSNKQPVRKYVSSKLRLKASALCVIHVFRPHSGKARNSKGRAFSIISMVLQMAR